MSRLRGQVKRGTRMLFSQARAIFGLDDRRGRRERVRSEREMLVETRNRQRLIFVALIVAMLVVSGRLAFWQIGQRSELVARAQSQQWARIIVPATRGEILDANGRILADSVTKYAVIADPDQIRAAHAMSATVSELARLLNLPPALVANELNVPGEYAALRDASGVAVLLDADALGPLENAIGSGALVGVLPRMEPQREYPDGTLAAQVIGFVRTSDGMGQYGVEQQMNQALAGQAGQYYLAVSATGVPLSLAHEHETAAIPGANVSLTIDANVQYWAEQGLAQTVQQMGADGGSVIVMDPHTGAIIAMASEPSFDPANYGQAPLASFMNPAVSSVYDPGSIMKAMTMATGIDTGAIAPASALYDTGVTTVDGVQIHNWADIGHGRETMTQVLQYSANVGAIWVAERVGVGNFDRYLRAFGFGSVTGINLPSESLGQLAHPVSAGDAELEMAENSFGEGIAVTPLQMVAAYGALANHGVLMRPYVISRITSSSGAVTTYGPQVVRQVVQPQTAQEVTQMLVDSAYVSEAQMNLVRGYTVAAKTGTSTPDPANPSVTYASVLGYAPASNPRFVLLVKIDHPRTTIFGGSAAGPLWRQLAERLFVYYRIAPDRAAG